MPGIARAPGSKNPGRRLSGGKTDGTADAQEVDVPSHDEERVRNTHFTTITCNGPDCPGNVRYVDGAKDHIRRHTRGNKGRATAYSPFSRLGRPVWVSPSRFPRLALAEPAERRLGRGHRRIGGRRLMLAVAPGAARALLVASPSARDADHASIVRPRRGLRYFSPPRGTAPPPRRTRVGAGPEPGPPPESAEVREAPEAGSSSIDAPSMLFGRHRCSIDAVSEGRRPGSALGG
jgi:hypothetical protein